LWKFFNPDMKIYIDSRIRDNVAVILKEGDKVVRSVTCHDPVEGVAEILKIENLQIQNIEKFELVNFPGSFTGLKIGAAAVNAFNFCLGKILSDKDIIIPNYGKEPNLTIKSFRLVGRHQLQN